MDHRLNTVLDSITKVPAPNESRRARRTAARFQGRVYGTSIATGMTPAAASQHNGTFGQALPPMSPSSRIIMPQVKTTIDADFSNDINDDILRAPSANAVAAVRRSPLAADGASRFFRNGQAGMGWHGINRVYIILYYFWLILFSKTLLFINIH